MNDEFDRALEAFKAAAAALDEAWTPEHEVRDYPAYLPSFDDFVADFAGVVRD